ncbi:MAG: cob(I)yrinic acid a,c-diamide adenosyltransferase [Candidatus Marinimicrobia bacterium]|nr:cob(I)yrinic acid a,c-diamide adenosyltransferase [Candidatus Neomarinimicrobiota bacterium]MCF7851432.1 cob(I)yrinic acid a,c-diamide adenosyltransferase [Candidatus Neomarinimicrobiota bacterium]
MRLTKIYTRTGDKGTTRLAEGTEVSKDSPYVEAYGDVDELNSAIGLVLSLDPDEKIRISLESVQHHLFDLGGELASAGAIEPLINTELITELEQTIDLLNNELDPLEEFVLPGGAETASLLHMARSICRRAERKTVSLSKQQPVNQALLGYLNRLSDLLFVMARYENLKKDHKEVFWKNPRR